VTENIDLKAEVQELAWAMIDEQATDKQVRRLEELLLQSAAARQTYVECMQLHADLHYLLGGKRSKKAAKRTQKASRVHPLEAVSVTTSPDVPFCNGSLR
jgi:hypothetical protein